MLMKISYTMKTNAFPIRSFAVLVVLAILSNWGSRAAQEITPPVTVQPIQKTLAPYTIVIEKGFLSTKPLEGRLNLRAKFPSDNTYASFVEAKLGTLIDVLRDLHTNANIVMEPNLLDIKILDLKLRLRSEADDAQLNDELSALQVASGNKFHWEQPGRSASIDPLTGLPTKTGSSSALYILSADQAAAAAKPHRIVEVFNVAYYVQGDSKNIDNKLEKIEEIVLSTVQGLKGADFSSEDQVNFRFHSGANLLIATGSQEAIDVARKVVNALIGHDTIVSEARSIVVMGGVSRPGTVQLPARGQMTIIDAIGLAGGTTKLANEKKIEFTRNGKSEIYSFENLKRMT
ncbi:MAG: hypothetical protein JWM99_2048, partial [Verrucomicrobiales bacterium]|nr:hypothetical protein [Verrucomicrobiales bacterium]